MSYTSFGDLSSTPLSGGPKPPSLLRRLTGVSTGSIKGAFGLTSKGTAYIQGVLALLPPSSSEHKIAILKSGLEDSWKRRSVRYRGAAMEEMLRLPAYRELILEELQKITSDYPNPRILTGESPSGISDIQDGKIYFDTVVAEFPPEFRETMMDVMSRFWLTRPIKRTGDEMIALWKTPCIKAVVALAKRSMTEGYARAKRVLQSETSSGSINKQALKQQADALIANNALSFAIGIDVMHPKEYYSDAQGNLIGAKSDRVINSLGPICGIPFYPDGSESQHPAVPPPPGAVDKRNLSEEGETPLAVAPLVPGTLKVNPTDEELDAIIDRKSCPRLIRHALQMYSFIPDFTRSLFVDEVHTYYIRRDPVNALGRERTEDEIIAIIDQPCWVNHVRADKETYEKRQATLTDALRKKTIAEESLY